MARKESVASLSKELIKADKTTAAIMKILTRKFGAGTDTDRTEEQLLKGIKYYASRLFADGLIEEKVKMRHVNPPGRQTVPTPKKAAKAAKVVPSKTKAKKPSAKAVKEEAAPKAKAKRVSRAKAKKS